jgi:hypothetical protein
MALLAVLLAMALLTGIGAALTAVGVVEYRSSRNHRSATRALLLADAGATHALALMRGPLAAYSYTDVLLGSDGQPDTEDDGVLRGYLLSADDALPDTGVRVEQGRYFVRVVNDEADPSGNPLSDTNHRFVALCRGETPDGGVAEVRVMLAAPSYPAIATNGDLYLPGHPSVLGPCGGIHANRIISVSGHPTVSGEVTASGDVLVTGVIYDPYGGIVTPHWAPPIDIPRYDPLAHCGNADYILQGGELVIVGTPSVTHSITAQKVLGWQYDSGSNTYQLTAKDAVEGTVCAHGNVKVIGNLGSPGHPFTITILATGSVQINGTPVIVSDIDDILIVATGDVQAGGNAATGSPYYAGLLYAGSQCQVNGTPVVDGHLLCFDAPDPVGALDLFDDNKINGDPEIRYDCSGEQRRTLMASWWESRAS